MILIRARQILVIGPTDAGKTTLIKRLYNHWCTRERVLVLDTDVGQSDIGPPGTLGLGTGDTPVEDLAQLQELALHFAGALSPSEDMAQFLWGVERLFRLALSRRPQRLLVDTTGWIWGGALSLKMAKCNLINPDLVIFITREETPLLRLLEHSTGPEALHQRKEQKHRGPPSVQVKEGRGLLPPGGKGRYSTGSSPHHGSHRRAEGAGGQGSGSPGRGLSHPGNGLDHQGGPPEQKGSLLDPLDRQEKRPLHPSGAIDLLRPNPGDSPDCSPQHLMSNQPQEVSLFLNKKIAKFKSRPGVEPFDPSRVL